jgi:hypothetical protein
MNKERAILNINVIISKIGMMVLMQESIYYF